MAGNTKAASIPIVAKRHFIAEVVAEALGYTNRFL